MNFQKKNTQLSTVWKNIDGCDEQCRFSTALFIFYWLFHSYNFIIDHDITDPGHGKYLFYCLGAVEKI